MKKLFTLSSLLILTLLFFSNCSDDTNSPGFESEFGLPTEYSYEISISCFCALSYVGPHFLHINEGQIVEYKLLNDEMQEIDDAGIASLTIESLIGQVNDFIAQDPVTQMIDKHPVYDFPMDVYFDVDERIADEEWGYVITDFRVIRD